MPQGICRLCQQETELRQSHVLPAFVFRWLKESAGNAHMRRGMEPNRRVQDGLKYYWLCESCEGTLNHYETAFANNLFYPYIEAPGSQFNYSNWLIQFCTSLSWRVLKYYHDEIHLNGWDSEQLSYVAEAEQVWRELLLGIRPHPGACQQHLLPFDQIASTSSPGELAPNINRYLMRAIDMDLCRGEKTIFTFSKIGRFIILGFIREPSLNRWRSTKVNANRGIIGPKKYAIQRSFWNYLDQKARRMSELLESMSEKQRHKVDQTLRKNIDLYYGSDAYQSMLADINMFGDTAFSKQK
jgi:hypothetical protein